MKKYTIALAVMTLTLANCARYKSNVNKNPAKPVVGAKTCTADQLNSAKAVVNYTNNMKDFNPGDATVQSLKDAACAKLAKAFPDKTESCLQTDGKFFLAGDAKTACGTALTPKEIDITKQSEQAWLQQQSGKSAGAAPQGEAEAVFEP